MSLFFVASRRRRAGTRAATCREPWHAATRRERLIKYVEETRDMHSLRRPHGLLPPLCEWCYPALQIRRHAATIHSPHIGHTLTIH